MRVSAKLRIPVFQTLQLYSLKKTFTHHFCGLVLSFTSIFDRSEVTSPMLFHETKDCLVLNTHVLSLCHVAGNYYQNILVNIQVVIIANLGL